jgi:hypothetical protein
MFEGIYFMAFNADGTPVTDRELVDALGEAVGFGPSHDRSKLGFGAWNYQRLCEDEYRAEGGGASSEAIRNARVRAALQAEQEHKQRAIAEADSHDKLDRESARPFTSEEDRAEYVAGDANARP